MSWLIPFLLIYFLLTCYLGWRIWQWLRLLLPAWSGLLFWPLYALAALSPLLERMVPILGIGRLIGHLRNHWLAVFAYSLIFMLLIDLVRLVIYLVAIIKGGAPDNSGRSGRLAGITGGLVILIIIMLAAYGNWQARQIRLVSYEVAIDKPAAVSSLRVVLASDLHLGLEMDARRLEPFVQAVNQQKPDLILLAGDLFDGRYTDLASPEKAARILSGLQATHGVYACLGNHDAGDDLAEKLAFLADAGIRTLTDKSVKVEGILLAGRLDRAPIGYQMPRRPLAELLVKAEAGQPVILMDHSPLGLTEARTQPVDLLVSGHTHNGQIFPGNLIVKAVYKNGYGYQSFGPLHTVVTSGVGTWGPPWRIATQAEIVVLTISFRQQ